jgi:hypothetical protein
MPKLNLTNLDFPMKVKDIPKFERQNSEICVNVLYFDNDEKDVAPIYNSPLRGRKHTVNLLLIEGAGNNSHYIWIKNMSRLVAHRTAHDGETFVCNYCLRPCSSADILERHVELCQRHPPQATRYPDPDQSVLEFKATHKQFYLPFYLVCDFEAFLVPVQEQQETDYGDEPSAKKHKVEGNTKAVDEHVISGFACKRVSSVPEYETPIYVYSGPDPMTRFFEHIMEESRVIGRLMGRNEEMLPLGKEEKRAYKEETVCPYCKGPFTESNWKVHHHCHVSGKYLSPACNNCNLQLKLKGRRRHPVMEDDFEGDGDAENQDSEYFIPIIFHNLKNYDAHFIIKHFQRKYIERVDDITGKVTYDDITVIPLNTEKFLMFEFGKMRFLDSFQFLSSSLEKLVGAMRGKMELVTPSLNVPANIFPIPAPTLFLVRVCTLTGT